LDVGRSARAVWVINRLDCFDLEEAACMKEKTDSIVTRFKTFLNEVVLEMKRSSWPERKTLVSHTVIVIVSVCMLGVFVGLSDKILAILLRLVVRQG
jgi:preprotein translocase subunit SecE